MILRIVYVFTIFLLITISVSADDSVIVTTGEGVAIATPDFATLEIHIQNTSQKAAKAVEMTTISFEKLVTALKEMGLTAKDITTSNFSVNQHWETKRDREREFIGYIASHRVNVRVLELNKVGEVIDVSVNAGATRIGGLRFESSNSDSVQEAALAEAVRTARRRAETMAEAAGGNLGSLIELTTEGPFRTSLSADMTVSTLNIETQLAPGDRIVRVTVLGKWKFDLEK